MIGLITLITIKLSPIHQSLESSHVSAKEHKSLETSEVSAIQWLLYTSAVSADKHE